MKNKLLYTLLVFALVSFVGTTPKKITWEDIANVEYHKTFSSEFKEWYNKPLFDESIQKLDNEKIQITGYFIPMDTKSSRYYLASSKYNTFESCIPPQKHTIIQLNIQKLPINHKVNEHLTFEGILKTNNKCNELPYSLENATLVTDEN